MDALEVINKKIEDAEARVVALKSVKAEFEKELKKELEKK
jgi:hypothetical protein